MATLRCGLACPHCLADDGRTASPDMPLPSVEHLLDQVAQRARGATAEIEGASEIINARRRLAGLWMF